MKKIIFIPLIFLILGSHLWCQEAIKPDLKKAQPVLDVYINCTSCDFQFLKENMKYLNFARDPGTADVHIIVTSLATGIGGREFMLEFSGKLKYGTLQDTLKFTTDPDISLFELRDKMLEKIQLGLVPFLLKTSFANSMVVMFDDVEENFQNNVVDKWRNWIFSIDFSGAVTHEKSFSNSTLSSGFYAAKVTSDIKLEIFAEYNFSESNYRFWDNDSLTDSYVSTNKDFGISGLLVKSAGEHVGIGCIAAATSSLYSNLSRQFIVAPTIEYNFYKYSDASRRQLIFRYSIGYEHSDYHEPTIYNKTNDRLFLQNLKIGFRMLEKFGSVDATLHGSNYLHNFSCFDLGADFRTNIKVCRGLLINFNFVVQKPQNQIYLPGSNLTTEEQLMGQKEMQTDYRFNCGMGFSYSFGSKNNNTVNPRFDF